MRHEFGRFKYAEEFAHVADENDLAWRMWRDPDRVDVEDGETYVHAVYVVEIEER